MGRARSASITPTFSADRALLLSNFPDSRVVSSVKDARVEVSKWMITEDAAFQRRSNLTTDEDWHDFIQSCAPEDDPSSVDLELLLKKCYSIAFAMPPSPTVTQRLPVAEPSGTGRSIPTLSV